jgi:hypothetical protein
VIDVGGGGTKLLMNNMRWELGSLQLALNHSRAMLLASLAPRLASEHSNLRTFLARLIVPYSSSEFDLRATAHIQRCGQTPRGYGVYSRCYSLLTAYHGSATPTGPWRGHHRRE